VKTAWCLLIAVMVVGMLGATDYNYNIGNFRPTDLSEYTLTPYYSGNSSYGYTWKNYSSYNMNNQIYLRGIVTKEKPGHYIYFDTDLRPRYSSSKVTNTQTDNGVYHARSWSPGFEAYNTATYRKYNNQFFWGGDFAGSYYQNRNNSTTKDTVSYSEYQNNHWNISNQLSGAIGYGRMYQCQEAYLAWYALNELDKSACLNCEFSNESVDDMATMFYNLRSLHEIDFRIIYREKAAKIMDYLKAKGYVHPSSESKAMAILLELWQNGNNIKRLVGTKLEVKPFIMAESIKESTRWHENQRDRLVYGYCNRYYYAKGGLELLFTNERPYHNVFQLSSRAGIQQGWYDGFYKEKSVDSLEFDRKPFTHLYADYAVAYYPDNRSSITLIANSGMWFNNLFEVDGQKAYKGMRDIYTGKFVNQSQNFNASLSLDGNYQLTYRMTVNATLTGSYSHQKVKDEPVWQKKGISTYINLRYQLL